MAWRASTASGPLAGVKVIDVSTVVFGPFATQIFGDLGADVIKVENGKGDVMRYAGKSPGEGLGPIYLNINRNKRSMRLDLSKETAKDALRRLIKDADVFFHNVRAAGMARLGFSYEDVKRINPDIVYVHCCGYGAGGAYEGRQAYDDLVQAASGAAGLLPMTDGSPPRYLPTLIMDKAAALYSAYATMASLFHRERTGEGQFVEVPMLEAATHFNMIENLYGQTFDPPTGRVAYTRSINPRRKPYKTKDGYIAILPYRDEQWETFFELGGREGVFDDERFSTYKKRTEHIGELYAIIEEVALTKTTKEWLDVLEKENVPVMRYNALDEVIDDPHLKSIDFFQMRDHPQAGRYRAIRHPVNFSRTPAEMRLDARPIGADTKDILSEIGFSEAEADEIASEK
jgi:crotonobetainyl-CoA:carnitine CoA-transferase CaiB-like acyl-CoA transferase